MAALQGVWIQAASRSELARGSKRPPLVTVCVRTAREAMEVCHWYGGVSERSQVWCFLIQSLGGGRRAADSVEEVGSGRKSLR